MCADLGTLRTRRAQRGVYRRSGRIGRGFKSRHPDKESPGQGRSPLKEPGPDLFCRSPRENLGDDLVWAPRLASQQTVQNIDGELWFSRWRDSNAASHTVVVDSVESGIWDDC